MNLRAIIVTMALLSMCTTGSAHLSRKSKKTASKPVTIKVAKLEQPNLSAPLVCPNDQLWLQSYNAGPGALVKYAGQVPYRETQNYLVRVSRYYHQDLSKNPYDAQIVDAAQKFGLDPQMVRAIAKAESDFKPRVVSSAGARGVMQVMPCTWAHTKKLYRIPWEYQKNVFDPEKNIYVACAYLSWLKHDFIPKNSAKLKSYVPNFNTEIVKELVKELIDDIKLAWVKLKGNQIT